MLLLTPRSLLVIGVAWTDPFVILMLAACACCALRAPRFLWIAVGGLAASKQYTAVMMPLTFLLLKEKATWRPWMFLMLRAGALALAIALPFFLWNPAAFVRNVIVLQFQLPFQTDALSFTAWLAHLTGLQIGASAGFIAAIAAIVWMARTAPRNATGFAGATALVMLIFFALNKQASCNYYFMVIGCCCLAGGMSASREAMRATLTRGEPSVFSETSRAAA
jgi:hypothetical protein